MNILVIGNGFDLAHGLPTRYSDLLDFCNILKNPNCYTNDMTATRQDMREYIQKEAANGFPAVGEIKELLLNNEEPNFWYELFKTRNYSEGNWVDFEAVIFDVIRSFDYDLYEEDRIDQRISLDEEPEKDFSNDDLDDFYSYCNQNNEISTYRELRDRIQNDLDKLCRAFELYLILYIAKQKASFISLDIEELEINYILSFNYTDTIKRTYRQFKDVDIDYIHGKACEDSSLQKNNMVLGIDEYLYDGEQDRNTDFIRFKKFYQRIVKGQEFKYREWCDEIKQEEMYETRSYEYLTGNQISLKIIEEEQDRGWENHEGLLRSAIQDFKDKHSKNQVYFFGHSMDASDKDILRELILNDNVQTTIFYHERYSDDKQELNQKVENLNRIIGQDELRKRTAGIEKSIIFKKQRDMKKTNDI